MRSKLLLLLLVSTSILFSSDGAWDENTDENWSTEEVNSNDSCQEFSECSDCIKSPNNCTWCANVARCFGDPTKLCCEGDYSFSQGVECPVKFPNLHPRTATWDSTVTNLTIGPFDVVDTAGTIQWGDVPCIPRNKSDHSFEGISCQLSKSGYTLILGCLHILVKLKTKRYVSNDTFCFVNPIITEISPSRGQLAGGTIVTIKGENLDAGRHVRAFIGRIGCKTLSKNGSEIQCRVSSHNHTGNFSFMLRFDGSITRHYAPGFRYVDNPIVGYNDPDLFRSIPAGGMNIKIAGEHFNAIDEAIMYISYNGTRNESSCTVYNDEKLICATPLLPVSPSFTSEDNFRRGGGVSAQFGLRINNLTIWKDERVTIYPNPKFDGYCTYDESQSELTFRGRRVCHQGEYFNSVGRQEYTILIDGTGCPVSHVDIKNVLLHCTLPGKSQRTSSTPVNCSSKFKSVTVHVGHNLAFNDFNNSAKIKNEEPPSPEEPPSSFFTDWKIVISVFLPVACLLVMVISVVVWRRNKRFTNELIPLRHQTGTPTVDNSGNENLYIMDEIYSLPLKASLEIRQGALEIDKKHILGSGNFGVVYNGSLTMDIDGVTDFVRVAVKSTKPDIKKGDLRALVKEIKIMSSLDKHKNIVHLFGIQTTQIRSRKFYAVVEYCSKGDLQTFLKDQRGIFRNLFDESVSTFGIEQNYVRIRGNESTPLIEVRPQSVSTLELLQWSKDIANGMVYLTEKKVIHGDLAARNVLLHQADKKVNKLTAKIGDFGLSLQIRNCSQYYKRKESVPLPMRWTALECWTSPNFSIQSDVWSYGITLWEIFSLIEVPYPGIPYPELFPTLTSGYKMPKPQYANDSLYAIMSDCWERDPKERPRFCDILDRIHVQELILEGDSVPLPSNDHVEAGHSKSLRQSYVLPNGRQETLINMNDGEYINEVAVLS